MSTPDEPQKLSPDQAAIIARARRSFLFTIGLLITGFIIIAGALVYRASKDGSTATTVVPDTAYAAPAVKIPAGATIVSAVASGGQVSVTYKNGSATSLRIFDGKTGAILREIPVVSE